MLCTRTPGIVGRAVHNSQKFRVRVLKSYRGSRSSGNGYESLTEVPDVPGTGVKVLQILQTFQVLWHGRTGRTELPGIVARAYRTYRSSAQV